MRLRNLILIFITITTMASLTNAQSCEDTLFKCDRALQSQRELTDIQKQIISDQEKRFAITSEALSRSNEELSKWYRDPVKVGAITLSLGLILGLTAGYVHGK
jgi:hypothetical protein